MKKVKMDAKKTWKEMFASKALMLLALLTLACNFAVATPQPNDPIWQARVYVQVADVADAGTDDAVIVSLRDGMETWIDSTADDFERNRSYLYDLRVGHLYDFQSIKYLRIRKLGSNGLCLKQIGLMVNGKYVYQKTFDGVGHWLDNDGVSQPEIWLTGNGLYIHSLWNQYLHPVTPTTMAHEEVEKRAESIIGNAILRMRWNQNLKVDWGRLYGPRYVEVVRATGFTIRLDADLKDASGQEIDVDFDLEVRCQFGRYEFNARNFVVRVYPQTYANNLFAAKVASAFTAEAPRSVANYMRTYECGTFYISSTADLWFMHPYEPSFLMAPTTSPLAKKATGANPVALPFDTFDLPHDTQLPVEAAPAETPEALAISLALNEEAATGEYTPYTVAVKLNAPTKSDAQVQIELPHCVVAGGAHVTVTDEIGTHVIEAQLSTSETGTALLSFADVLAAGVTRQYTVQLWFGEQPSGETFVTTTVSGKVLAAPVESRTSFKVANGKVQPQGTVQFVGQKTEGSEEVNPRK